MLELKKKKKKNSKYLAWYEWFFVKIQVAADGGLAC